jgi:hypothetical protein
MLKRWVADANARFRLETQVREREAAGLPPLAPAAAAPTKTTFGDIVRPDQLSGAQTLRHCLLCYAAGEEWQMYKMHVCKSCADVHMVPGGTLYHGPDQPA